MLKSGNRRVRHAATVIIAASIGVALITQTGAAASSAPVQLTFWTNLTTASQSSVIKAQALGCAAKIGNNVSLNFEAVPFSDMYTRMATAFSAGQGPDIMNTTEGGVIFGQASGNTVPMDDVINQHGRSDFLPSYLQAVSTGNQTWGVPDWALHQEVYYRKDLFAKYNIAIPTTWPKLLAAAVTITQKESGVKGMAISLGSTQVAPQYWYQFLYSNGVYTFDPQTGKYIFDKSLDKAVVATQFMLDLYKKVSPPESVTWSWTDFRTAFVQGKLGMVLDFGAVIGQAQSQNPSMLANIGSFQLPAPKVGQVSGGNIGGGYFYMVGKSNASREKLAKSIVSCMMNRNLTAARANSRPVFALPATRSAAQSSTYLSNPTVQQFRSVINTIRRTSLPNWYRYGMEGGLNALEPQIEATTFIGDNLQSAALGHITATQAVAAINAQLKKLAGA